MIEFVSYNGRYPCLCVGDLILRIDGEEVNLGACLTSGGSCTYDGELEWVEEGKWSVDVPQEYARYKAEITALVNACVPHGCCGGCI